MADTAQHPFMAWLETAVETRGTSWRQLAFDAGVSASALSALRTGRADRPSMETCVKLSGQLGVEPAYLLGLAGYSTDLGAVEPGAADPELDMLVLQLRRRPAAERESVKEFMRFALSKSARRARAAR